MSLDPVLVLTARCFLALLLLAAGLHKRANLGRVRDAIAAYCAVPIRFEKLVAWLVIGVEVTVGVALIVPNTTRLGALAAAALFAVYFVVMGLSWVRGHREVDCGCSFHHGEASLSASHLVRNVWLVILAVGALCPDSRRATDWLDDMQIAAAVACLALLYLSADALLAQRGMSKEGRRTR